MERRKFIRTGAAGAIAVAGSRLAANVPTQDSATQEIIEWRVYEMAWGGNQGLLRDYLLNTLQPALRRKGATQLPFPVLLPDRVNGHQSENVDA